MKFKFLFFPLVVTAGAVNVLLGAGGGVFLLLALACAAPELSVQARFALTNAVIFVFSLFSVTLYLREGRLELAALSPLILPALLGGALGAFLLTRIRPRPLKLLFALLLLFSGGRMLL